MKLKKPLLALFAATAILGATGCAPTPAEVKQSVETTYAADLQNTLTGYFNSHGMKAQDVKEGLTIPWNASQATLDKIRGDSIIYPAHRSGYMVATGKLSDEGCPVFDVTVIKDTRDTTRYETQVPVCPKPATPQGPQGPG
ncbi:MAG: hypothetical protein ACAH80_08350 [Alphaproteobacteria bacterium]